MDRTEELRYVIDELVTENERPALYRMLDRTIHIPSDTFVLTLDILRWAADEIAQLTEDRKKAIQLAIDLALQVSDLEEELSDYRLAEERADHRLDSFLGI